MTTFILGVLLGTVVGWSTDQPAFVTKIKEKILAKFK
jgi:F0F1-type ATP synthase assembly protein I